MTIDSVDSLVEVLRAARMLDSAQLERLTQDAPHYADPRVLGRELVKRGWITPFQVNQIFQGRGAELVKGSYLLLERLGAGRIGPTYKALQQPTGRVVSLKIVAKEVTANQAAVSRLREAVREAAQPRHPHLATIFEAEAAGDDLGLPMEFVEGTDLASLVRRSGPLSVADAAECICQAARGLEHLHSRNRFHGAVAATRMVSSPGRDLVKLLGADLTHVVATRLDVAFPTECSDLADLGATLFFLLCGKELPTQPADARLMAGLSKEVPLELVSVIEQMLGRSSEGSLATIADAIQLLAPFSKSAHSATMTMSPALARAVFASSSLAVSEETSAPLPREALSPTTPSEGVTPPAYVAPEALPDEAAAALVDSVTSDSTFSGAQPVAPPSDRAPRATRILETIRKRPWQMAAGGSLFLFCLGLLVWSVISSGQAGRDRSNDDGSTKKNAAESSQSDKLPLDLLTVLGGTQGRHWGAVRCAAWSAKDKLVATGGDDNAIRLWDADTLEDRGVLHGHKDAILCLAFSPDGRFLLSGGNERALFLWDVRDRKQSASLVGHAQPIHTVVFSADGRLAVSAALGEPIIVWNVAARERQTVWNGIPGPVSCFCLSADARQALVGSTDRQAYLWDVVGNKLITTYMGHKAQVNHVAFAPGGKSVLTASSDGTLRLWDLDGKKARSFEGRSGAIASAEFVSGGRQIVSAGTDGVLRRWDAEKGKEIVPALAENLGPVAALAFSPDGARVLSIGRSNVVRLWDAIAGTELVPRSGHAVPVQSVALSPDGRYALTGAADDTVRLWDVGSSQETRKLKGSTSGARVVAFANNQQAVAVFADGTARVWYVPGGDVRGSYTWKITDRSSGVAFTPDSGRVIIGELNGSSYIAALRDLGSGELARVLANHFTTVRCVAVSSDGALVLSGSEDWKVRLSALGTDKEQGKELLRLVGPTGVVLSVAFARNGTAVAVAADRTVWQWDLKTGQDTQLADLDEPASFTPFAAAFSPDGATLAYCGTDGRLVLRDVQRGTDIQRLQMPGPIANVVFSADGRFLATANANGTASVFRLANATKK